MEEASAVDLARAAHHADAAGNTEAVLKYATAAGDYAGELGASREAAAQYGRALRFADHLGPKERAELLERRAYACYLIGDVDDALEAQQRALDCNRQTGDRLRKPTRSAPFRGCFAMSDAVKRRWARGLRLWPCSRSFHRDMSSGWPGATSRISSSTSKTPLERSTGEPVHSSSPAGSATPRSRPRPDEHRQSRSALTSRDAQSRAGARPRAHGEPRGARGPRFRRARMVVPARAVVRDPPMSTSHPVSSTARNAGSTCGDTFYSQRGQGRCSTAAAWTRAADPHCRARARLAHLCRDRRAPTLGLMRARRGDPEAWPALQEAWGLGRRDSELQRMEPPSVARAEALWLLGRPGEVVPSTQATFELALEKKSWWIVGELACWRRRSGAEEEIPEVPEPWAAELAGDWRRAQTLGSPRRSLRGCPGAGSGGRRGGARGCSRAPPPARCPTGCRGRRTASEKTGRSQPSAWPPAGDAGQSCRAHFTGARGARPCRDGPSERRDCRPACPLQTHGRPSRLGDPPGARGPNARRGGCRRTSP